MNIAYLLGLATYIEAGGVAMNIRIANFIGAHDNHQEKKQQLSLQIGLLSSALEHAVPEQMFSDTNSAVKPESVSAVKALQKADTLPSSFGRRPSTTTRSKSIVVRRNCRNFCQVANG